ncbi:MAG: GGDEF domain-containing protein, partial [Thermodesulfobacteria bacterium]|nr:GGDEF domain-containing protein [Thermodesulfobacteriota bacterium]
PQEIYSRLARVIKKKFDFSNFVIFEVSNNQNRVEPVVVEPPCLLEESCYQEIEGRPTLCRVFRQAVKASSLHFTETCEYFRDPDLNYLCLPLYTGGHVIGIIHFLLPITFRLEEKYRTILNRIEAYLQEAAPVLEAKRFAQSLREISLRDTLTGLYNRRILDDLVPQVAAGVARRGSIMGVLMIDIDHFKVINDTYGHSFGDRIIKSVASMIQDELRTSDLAIRFGGEEFLCLLVDVEPGMSLSVAERIRQKIESNSFVYEGRIAVVTVSIGVAEFPIDDRNLWNVITFADLALYQAKRQGRNQTVRFEREFLVENPRASRRKV